MSATLWTYEEMTDLLGQVSEHIIFPFRVVGDKYKVEVIKLPSESSIDRFHQLVMREVKDSNAGRWQMVESMREIHNAIVRQFEEWRNSQMGQI